MNKGRVAILMSLSAAVCLLFAVPSVHSRIITNVPADISGNELKAIVIADFENAVLGDNGWQVDSVPKKFTKAETEQKLKMKNPIIVLEMKLISGGPNDMNVEEWSVTDKGKKKEKCLGVKFQFKYPGTNQVHILAPPQVDWKDKSPKYTFNPSTGKDEQERGIELPGQCKGISIWVHGRGHPYNLEAWVKDYRGSTHIIKFGSVNFVGWRPMKAFIPVGVPQSFESFPQTRVTKITRFVLRAVPNAPREELMEMTYFFFDQLKVLTDTYEVNFDGNELHKIFDGGKSGEKKTQ
ncbi:MAG: endoflagellar filament sheath protein [Spirochaetes bacterium]|nr:endoflagellar filament sheath protein [Spirochaetota bacterium]